MSQLPLGWQLSNLDELARAFGGGTPSKAEPSNWVGGTVPWVSPKDMKRFFIRSTEDQIAADAAERLSVIPAESVLTVVRSGILSRTLPVALNKIPVTVNQDMRAFVPELDVSAMYLAWQLIAKEQEILASCSKHGTTVASIEGPALSRFPVALAPAPEQTRIVAKLEELLSDLDVGVAELKAAQKKLAQYRQSLLKAAVEGALTAEWRRHNPPKETGADLLARILTERRARWEAKQLAKFESEKKTPPKEWRSKYPKPLEPDREGLPDLPTEWVWSSLDALIEDGPQNGLYLPSVRYGSGISILRIDDYQIGWHRARTALRLVDATATEAVLYSLHAGDIVINRVNSMTHLGKALCVSTELDGALFESNMMRLKLADAVVSQYVSFYLGSDVGRTRLIKNAKWAVNQASINQHDVRATPIPLPCTAEQATILAALNTQTDGADAQANAIAYGIKQSTAQRQNILRAAFAGQLVPQDPNDEPASVLLERIRAERAKVSGNKRPVKTRVRA